MLTEIHLLLEQVLFQMYLLLNNSSVIIPLKSLQLFQCFPQQEATDCSKSMQRTASIEIQNCHFGEKISHFRKKEKKKKKSKNTEIISLIFQKAISALWEITTLWEVVFFPPKGFFVLFFWVFFFKFLFFFFFFSYCFRGTTEVVLCKCSGTHSTAQQTYLGNINLLSHRHCRVLKESIHLTYRLGTHSVLE